MSHAEPVILDIRHPVVKSASAIGVAFTANTGIAGNAATSAAERIAINMQNPELFWAIISFPWGPIASMIAAFYTLALFMEWLWKKPISWFLIRIKIKEKTRLYTKEEWCKIEQEDEDEKK